MFRGGQMFPLERMISTMRATIATALLLSSLAIAAPTITEAQVYVRIGPPRPLYERRPIAPGPGYAWQGGYHRWDGSRYTWIPGNYVAAPRPRAYWVPGRWINTRRGYYWRDGYWR